MTVRRIEGGLPVAFRYTPGVGNTAFLEALRDRGVFLGSRCEDCGVTYLPARIFCERCLASLTPDTECGPEGTLESWTVAHRDVDGNTLDAPVTYALVRLDGADTVLLHRLLAPAAIGARVRAVVAPDRSASIHDIEGFEPA
jgi:uncharacterized OB-fold protein